MHFCWHFLRPLVNIPLAEAITSHEENDEEHPVDGFSKHLLNAYYDHSAEVDDEIRAHLRNWTMERLPRVSLTILRLAIAEMLFGGENKPGVAINEAVELTKKYGADEDYQFVNGLLGAVARDHGLDADAAAGRTVSRYTLGIDTSNYATSLAVFDTAGEVVCAKKRFLPVKAGQLGLRQKAMHCFIIRSRCRR